MTLLIIQQKIKNLSVVEMDTVYNNGSTGPFMQTFKFLDYSFMFIVYQEEKRRNQWSKESTF